WVDCIVEYPAMFFTNCLNTIGKYLLVFPLMEPSTFWIIAANFLLYPLWHHLPGPQGFFSMIQPIYRDFLF
ncbi:hypothetical protein, partial [Agrilactobacillus composti]|uniref:hypothetical protein n=1 Tax=Agrilactobacillus composti TaxID=398555 RepID=UPI001F286619